MPSVSRSAEKASDNFRESHRNISEPSSESFSIVRKHRRMYAIKNKRKKQKKNCRILRVAKRNNERDEHRDEEEKKRNRSTYVQDDVP